MHHRLITAIANAIESNLSLNYRVAIEKRVYTSVPEDSVLVGVPSDSSITVMLPVPQEIREGYLEIRDTATGAVITGKRSSITSTNCPATTGGRSSMGRYALASVGIAVALISIRVLGFCTIKAEPPKKSQI